MGARYHKSPKVSQVNVLLFIWKQNIEAALNHGEDKSLKSVYVCVVIPFFLDASLHLSADWYISSGNRRSRWRKVSTGYFFFTVLLHYVP